MRRSFLVSLLMLWLLFTGIAAAEMAARDPYTGPQPEPGFLGISVRWVPAGIEILSVDTGGPGDQAGLKPYDVLVGQADPLTPTILKPFRSCPPGTRRIVHVTRSGEHMTFRCTWETMSADRRLRLERRMATATGLLGQVEVVSGRKVGIRLFAPAGRIPRLAEAKASLQRGKEHLSALSILHGQDDWRVVAEVSESSVAPQVNDLALFQWEQPQVATAWGPNWRPAPAPAPKTYRHTGRRKVRVPSHLLNPHLELVQSHFDRMLSALPPGLRALGSDTRMMIDATAELNAGAGLDRRGRPVITVTRGMVELIFLLAYVGAAADEQTLEAALNDIDRLAFVAAARAEHFPLPKGFAARTRDAAFLRRLDSIAKPMYCFVLGHELGHLALAHQAQDESLLGRMVSGEQEMEADKVAARIVQETGGDEVAVLIFTSYMAKVEQYKGSEGDQSIPDYLQGHPDWVDRTSYLLGVFSTN